MGTKKKLTRPLLKVSSQYTKHILVLDFNFSKDQYVIFQDEDLATIAAQRYYIEYSPSPQMVIERLHSLLPSFIPDSSLQGAKSLKYWMQSVFNTFKDSCFVRDRMSPLKVKEEIVNYAKYKWPLLFSRFYEAYKFAGRWQYCCGIEKCSDMKNNLARVNILTGFSQK